MAFGRLAIVGQFCIRSPQPLDVLLVAILPHKNIDFSIDRVTTGAPIEYNLAAVPNGIGNWAIDNVPKWERHLIACANHIYIELRDTIGLLQHLGRDLKVIECLFA